MTIDQLLALPDAELDRMVGIGVMKWHPDAMCVYIKEHDWMPSRSIADAQMLYGPIEERGLWDEFIAHLMRLVLGEEYESLNRVCWLMLRASPKQITVAAIAACAAGGGE